jgi:hypothetical protein
MKVTIEAVENGYILYVDGLLGRTMVFETIEDALQEIYMCVKIDRNVGDKVVVEYAS